MEQKQERIVAAIGELNPEDKAHFTKNGFPSSSVLTEMVGETVSAAERDACWKLFEESDPEKFKAMQAVLNPKKDDQESATKTEEKVVATVTGQDALKHLRAKGVKI